METQKAVVITDTDSAREYLVQWMREHFPSDRTFSAHIREELAGDFAWQLAKALSEMQSPDAAAVSRAVAALEPFAKLAHLFSPEKRRANVPTTGLIVSWPRLGPDGEMVEHELTVEHLREADAAFRAAAGLPEVERASWRLSRRVWRCWTPRKRRLSPPTCRTGVESIPICRRSCASCWSPSAR